MTRWRGRCLMTCVLVAGFALTTFLFIFLVVAPGFHAPARPAGVQWYSTVEQASSAPLKTFERCLKEFPGSRHKTEWTLALGRAYVLAERKDKASKLLDEFVRQHSGTA